jgi:hypothetical protein
MTVSGVGTIVQVRLRISDIEPFDETEYEPFVLDQVWYSVHAYFQIAGEEVRFELYQCNYSA